MELRNIWKKFPGVIANKNVNMRVRRAEAHAICGENGAGKSTLMKTLYGMHQPTEGEIFINGEEKKFSSPTEAIDVGIGMVHQHFMLAGNLTVTENIVLGDERGAIVDFKAARQHIIDVSKKYGLNVDPDALVGDLGVGAQQRVEILKVLYRGAKIIILDEPTAVLVPQEVDELFDSLRQLKGEGVTIIFITHKLDEVLALADGITIIRRGETVGQVDDPSAITAKQLAEMMVGSELPQPERGASTVTDKLVLELKDVTVMGGNKAALDRVSVKVHAGEVVGIAGVEGNGQTELTELIMGLETLTNGSVSLEGREITHDATQKRRSDGIAFVPEDRHKQALLLHFPLWENRILGFQWEKSLYRGGLIDAGRARQDSREIIDEWDVRTPDELTSSGALSGGNQQKFIIGREMKVGPRLLIASQPTRGVDVGAQAQIWDKLKEARAAGLAILLISADLEELIGLSDKLFVMYKGKLVAKFDPREVTSEQLGGYMTGAVKAEGEVTP